MKVSHAHWASKPRRLALRMAAALAVLLGTAVVLTVPAQAQPAPFALVKNYHSGQCLFMSTIHEPAAGGGCPTTNPAWGWWANFGASGTDESLIENLATGLCLQDMGAPGKTATPIKEMPCDTGNHGQWWRRPATAANTEYQNYHTAHCLQQPTSSSDSVVDGICNLSGVDHTQLWTSIG